MTASSGPRQLASFYQTNSACTTCTGTPGNGAQTGTTRIITEDQPLMIPQVHSRGQPAFYAEAASMMPHFICDVPGVIAKYQHPTITETAFESSENNEFPGFIRKGQKQRYYDNSSTSEWMHTAGTSSSQIVDAHVHHSPSDDCSASHRR